MKLVIQRVKEASVSVDGRLVSSIGRGLLVLCGIAEGDTPEHARRLAAKTAALRIMADDAGVMNRSVLDVGGEILVVSQFTLLADTSRGNRPSYVRAARQPLSTDLYELYVAELERLMSRPVPTGIFGADMAVSLVNDGPVTIILEA